MDYFTILNDNASDLHRASDEMAKIVRSLELRLSQAGVRAQVKISERDEELCLDSAANGLAIFVRSPSGDKKRWAECAMPTKLDSFVMLPKLLDEIAARAKKMHDSLPFVLKTAETIRNVVHPPLSIGPQLDE